MYVYKKRSDSPSDVHNKFINMTSTALATAAKTMRALSSTLDILEYWNFVVFDLQTESDAKLHNNVKVVIATITGTNPRFAVVIVSG